MEAIANEFKALLVTDTDEVKLLTLTADDLENSSRTTERKLFLVCRIYFSTAY